MATARSGSVMSALSRYEIEDGRQKEKRIASFLSNSISNLHYSESVSYSESYDDLSKIG